MWNENAILKSDNESSFACDNAIHSHATKSPPRFFLFFLSVVIVVMYEKKEAHCELDIPLSIVFKKMDFHYHS